MTENKLIIKHPIDSWVHHKPTGAVSEVFIGYKGTIEPFAHIGDFTLENYESITFEEALKIAEEKNR